MHARIQIASIAFAVLLFTGVFELVRRRYLRERYAILWLTAGAVLIVLAIWKELLTTVSKAVGIYYPPNAFFVIGFAFLLMLLLHFSVVVSKISDETRVLAQKLALMEQEQQQQQQATARPEVSVEPEPSLPDHLPAEFERAQSGS